jgi:uncharacterized protein (UPF0332 family)
MKRRQVTRKRKPPIWEVWLKYPHVCEQSLRYFERHAQVRALDAAHAQNNVLGHMRKAFHNLSLANQILDTNQKGQVRVKYAGENFYDWVVTVCYYAMYQASLAALAAVRKSSENHSATVCALIYYYVHKKKRLNEQYLLSFNTIGSLANQDVQKLVDTRFEREKASYDTGFATQLGLAQTSLSETRDFILKIREILEDGLGKDFLKDV